MIILRGHSKNLCNSVGANPNIASKKFMAPYAAEVKKSHDPVSSSEKSHDPVYCSKVKIVMTRIRLSNKSFLGVSPFFEADLRP